MSNSEFRLSSQIRSMNDRLPKATIEPISTIGFQLNEGATVNDFPRWTDQELFAYLDEQLTTPVLAELEHELRNSAALRARLGRLMTLRNSGEHSVGEIWREQRLSCPDRNVLRRYLLDILDDELKDYIRFHTESVGCRYCNASLADLSTAGDDRPETETRTRRYFESSAGELPKPK